AQGAHVVLGGGRCQQRVVDHPSQFAAFHRQMLPPSGAGRHNCAAQTTVVDHPLAQQALTPLRDVDTDRTGFRHALADLAGLLVYEATRSLRTEEVDVATPLARAKGCKVAEPPMIVPILRAGLGLMGGVL